MSGIHAPSRPVGLAPGVAFGASQQPQQSAAPGGGSRSGGGCACAQAAAGAGALGGVDAARPPAGDKPVKVDAPKVDKLQTDGPRKLPGETSHAGLSTKAQSILGSAQAAGLKLISGVRPGDDGGHGNGTAVDVANVPGGSRQGSAEMKAFAESVRAAGKAGDPNVGYVIYEQKIASARDNWAWRPMEDRGSNTANHYDHVHVSTDPGR